MPNHHAVSHRTASAGRLTRTNTGNWGTRAVVQAGVTAAGHAAYHIGKAGVKYVAKEVPKYLAKKKKSKPVSLKVGTPHDSITESFMTVHKGLKIGKNQSTYGKWVQTNMYSNYISCQSGSQSITDIQYLFSPDQMFNSVVNAAPGPLDSYIGLAQLNPYMNTTGSSYLAPTTSATVLEDRFLVKGASLNVELTNVSAVGAILDAYLCVARGGAHSVFPVTAFDLGFSNEAYGQGIGTYSTPGTRNTAISGWISHSIPLAKPSDSPAFKKYWKILSVKHIDLTGASTHVLKIDVTLNKVMKRDLQVAYVAPSPVTPMVAGQTHCLFIIARGNLGNDVTNIGTTGEIPTYLPVKVAYAVKTEYRACAVKGNASRLGSNQLYDRIPFDAAVGNLTLMNERDVEVNLTAAAASAGGQTN